MVIMIRCLDFLFYFWNGLPCPGLTDYYLYSSVKVLISEILVLNNYSERQKTFKKDNE